MQNYSIAINIQIVEFEQTLLHPFIHPFEHERAEHSYVLQPLEQDKQPREKKQNEPFPRNISLISFGLYSLISKFPCFISCFNLSRFIVALLRVISLIVPLHYFCVKCKKAKIKKFSNLLKATQFFCLCKRSSLSTWHLKLTSLSILNAYFYRKHFRNTLIAQDYSFYDTVTKVVNDRLAYFAKSFLRN